MTFILKNEFILNVDLKRLYTSDTPKFRRGDTVEIIFNFYDDGIEYSLDSATKAEVRYKTSKNNRLTGECDFIMYKGKRAVRLKVEPIAMVELGYTSLVLTVWEDDSAVSIQPFNIFIYDDYVGSDDGFLDLIGDLQQIIENLVIDLNKTVKLADKGVPNGVASLDENGKIPLVQMPREFDSYLEHILETVYDNQVHGLKIDQDGLLMYKNIDSDWQYVGFSDRAGSGGGGQQLDATVNVVDGIATVTWIGMPTATTRKWSTGIKEVPYFTLDGTTFIGDSFEVNQTGLHTLYYRDSNGVDYVKAFDVTMAMLPKPVVTVDVADGFVDVEINKPTQIKKWSKGVRDVSYFAYNGTTFTGNTFQVNEVGDYTIYYKLTNGLEYVHVFTVTASMLEGAIISVTGYNGIITVSHKPTNYIVQIAKYEIGTKDTDYFATKGTEFTNNTFTVTQELTYTVYHKYTNGLEATTTFNVTSDMLPPKDTTAPILTVTQTPVNSKTVLLTATATDYESGVKNITKPDGTVTTQNPTTYTVTANGTYTFKATDNADNVRTTSIQVNTIIDIPDKIYGVVIDYANSNPETSVTYTNAAIGMTAGTAWDSVYPFSEIKPVLLSASGKETKELLKTDYTKDVSGNPVNITSGENVMIKIPKFYVKMETIGTKLYVRMATYAVDSTYQAFAHSDGTNVKEQFYIGAYLGYQSGSTLKSWSGRTPTDRLSLTNARSYARSNGDGYNLLGFYQLTAIQVLQLLRSKTINSQSFYGIGVVRASGTALAPTGNTNNKGMYSGSSSSNTEQVKVMGIEDFYGNNFYWIDGIRLDNSVGNYAITTTKNPSTFSDSGEGYDNVGNLNLADGGYISKVQGTTGTGFIAKEFGGSENTYFSDYTYIRYRHAQFGGGVYGSLTSTTIPLSGAYLLYFGSLYDSSSQDQSARLMYV